jgi:hypothetical protein
VAESASLVAVHRQLLIVKHQLAEQLDLLDLIVRRRRQALDRLRLNAIDLGLDLRNFLQCLGRKYRAAFLRARQTRAQGGRENGCCDQSKRGLSLHVRPSVRRS